MIAAAVLAAGASRRLGRPKQLVLFRGVPLVQRALEAARGSGAIALGVVLGAEAEAVGSVLPPDVDRVPNDAWREGLASSVRAAVGWARSRSADALALLLADQPLVGPAHVRRLVEAWHSTRRTAASSHEGTLGAPAVFDASFFDALAALRGDAGVARMLRAGGSVIGVPCPEAALDVDVPDDVVRLEIEAARSEGRLTT